MWKFSEIRWACLAIGGIVLAMGLRPSDSPWFFDMSRDFEIALKFNAMPSRLMGISLPFTPASYGLEGTHGIRYGPLPIWLDQAFLLFTRDLVAMSAIRAVAVGGLTAFGLLWLTRLLGVSAWLAVVTMLSPWVWYYSRQLWDNSLSIPLAVLLLASYGQFFEKKSAWAIGLVVLFGTLSCLVHLIALPFLLVIFLHAMIFERRWIWKFRWQLLGTATVMFVISEPYLRYAVAFHGSHVPAYEAWWHGWIFALFGAQHLTAQNIGYLLEENWEDILPGAVKYTLTAACMVSCIGYIASWIGMAAAVPPARRAMRQSGETNTLDSLCLIGLATVLVQIIFDGVEHVSLYPHYYNTTWIIYVMFAWLGLDGLPKWLGSQSVFARMTVPAYACSLAVVLIIVGWQIARNGGMKGNHYNAALSNQIAAAREISQFSSDSPIEMKVNYWRNQPDTLRVLRELVKSPVANSPGPVRRVVVRFRDAFPGDARIVVENEPVVVEAGAQ